MPGEHPYYSNLWRLPEESRWPKHCTWWKEITMFSLKTWWHSGAHVKSWVSVHGATQTPSRVCTKHTHCIKHTHIKKGIKVQRWRKKKITLDMFPLIPSKETNDTLVTFIKRSESRRAGPPASTVKQAGRPARPGCSAPGPPRKDRSHYEFQCEQLSWHHALLSSGTFWTLGRAFPHTGALCALPL